MKKFRLYYWLVKAYIARHRSQVLLSGLFLFLFVVNFNLVITYIYKPFFTLSHIYSPKTEIVEGLVGNVKVINPVSASTSSEKEISELVFRGLTKIKPDGSVAFDIADKVEAQSDKNFIFHLHTNIYWHDGQKLTADDVVYTYKILSNPYYKTGYESTFKDIQITKIDDYTVEFKLKDSFSPFLSETSIGIIPKHIPLARFKPIGTGSLKVTAFNNEKVTLENDKTKLIFKFYATPDLAIAALKQGEIQSIGGLSYDQIKEFYAWPNLSVKEATVADRYLALYFNTKNSILSTRSLRQAILYALDKNKIIASDKNQVGEEALTSIGGNSWARSDDVRRYNLNVDFAKAAFDKEGWKVSGDMREKDGSKLTVSIAYLDIPSFNKMVSVVEFNLSALNIKVNRRPFNTALLDQVIKNRDFDMILTFQALEPDPDQYVLWHSTLASSTNLTSLSSPRVDKDLEDGRKTIDVAERKAKYKDFERSLTDEAPALFLYYPKYFYIMPKNIKNVSLQGFSNPVDRFDSLSNWISS